MEINVWFSFKFIVATVITRLGHDTVKHLVHRHCYRNKQQLMLWQQ